MKLLRVTFVATCAGACLWVSLIAAGCRLGPDEDLSSKKPYADLIGAKYAVVSDELRAYGVYESLDDKQLSWVELIPLLIRGSELAFTRAVPKGQVIRILSAWQRRSLLRPRIFYFVELENSTLAEGVPVKLELSRGNEGADADLNPAIYKRLPSATLSDP